MTNQAMGQRLRKIREHRGISQGRLAKAIGMTVGIIQMYEHGRVQPAADRLEQLARALQCEPVDLLAPPETPPPRYRRPRYSALAGLIVLAAGTLAAAPGRPPPQLALDLEELAYHFERIEPDDLA